MNASTNYTEGRGRAVVLGASLAGLLAARVLSEHYDDVVLLERDELPGHPAARKGTPQAVHPHGLLARGLDVLEELFPGFGAAMVRRGGLLGDMQQGCGFYANRQRFAVAPAGRAALGASRLAIEAEVRQRVLARPGVRALTGVDVLRPRLEGGRVVAACYRQRTADGTLEVATRELSAELVVDCTGRASHLRGWLCEWGYEAPFEERVEIGICYTSAYFKRSGACADGPGLDLVAEFGAVTNEQPCPGVVIAQEPQGDEGPRWVVGVGGYRGDHAAATLPALRQRAAEIGSPMLNRVAQHGELIGDVMRYHMPHSQRRYYEKLRRFPGGLLAMGDALTSFNPIYGQGITVAACEALELHAVLSRSPVAPRQKAQKDLARQYFSRAARVIDIPWQLAVGGDLSIDKVPGHRPLPVRLVNRYIARLYRVAPHDAVVSSAFQQVVHMLKGPQTLFAPHIVWRALTTRTRRPAAPSGQAQPAL